MKQTVFVIIAIMFLLLFISCSKEEISFDTANNEVNSAVNSFTEKPENEPEPIQCDLDIVNYLHLVSQYGNGVSFCPGEDCKVYYNRFGEVVPFPIETTENDISCFDYKFGSTFIVIKNKENNKLPRLIFTDDNGKNWNVSAIDIASDISEMYISSINKSSAYFVFNTVDNKNEYSVFCINKNGTILEHKADFSMSGNDVSDITFISENIGYIVGQKENRPLLLRTQDGGTNWENVELCVPEKYDISFNLLQKPVFYGDIGFIRNDAYYTGDSGNQEVVPYCYISCDNGTTWRLFSESVNQFDYSEENAWGIIDLFENETLNVEEKSTDEDMIIIRELIEKATTFQSFIREMGEFGAYKIKDSETFQEGNSLFAEYDFEKFSEFEKENQDKEFNEEVYAFSSLKDIETHILSFFNSVEDSNCAEALSLLFREKDGKLFYNTDDFSFMCFFGFDRDTLEIANKKENVITVKASSMYNWGGSFTVIKNEDGEWRLTKDILT